jgi:hypothetical protein
MKSVWLCFMNGPIWLPVRASTQQPEPVSNTFALHTPFPAASSGSFVRNFTLSRE